jgi:flagellar motor switch protein FliM
MADRILSQAPISTAYQKFQDSDKGEDISERAQLYDFRRPDRIAKDQLRSIHVLHENFARSVASSLSAFLRSYVTVSLMSVEQLSFTEFVKCLPSPSCMVSLGLRPFEGNAILELGHSLVFPIFEMLLGGSGKNGATLQREITEIEKSILDSVFRVILQDLKTAWQAVSFIDFTAESHESEPQLLQILAPNEAIVAISMEMKIGENSGFINIGIPSIVVKMLRQRFDQQWNLRRSQPTEAEYARVLKLIRTSEVEADVRLNGPALLLEDLMKIEVGDVLTLNHAVNKELELLLNGTSKFVGHVVAQGRNACFRISDARHQ